MFVFYQRDMIDCRWETFESEQNRIKPYSLANQVGEDWLVWRY